MNPSPASGTSPATSNSIVYTSGGLPSACTSRIRGCEASAAVTCWWSAMSLRKRGVTTDPLIAASVPAQGGQHNGRDQQKALEPRHAQRNGGDRPLGRWKRRKPRPIER